METKDIQYFLDAENAFKEAHTGYGKPLYDESMVILWSVRRIEQIF